MAKTREQRNSSKAPLNQHGITVQIEHFSYSPHDIFYLELVRCYPNFELRHADHFFYAHNASIAIHVKYSLERAGRDPFQPWNQMRLVKSYDRPPIIR